MKKYEVSWFNLGSGKFIKKIVEAETEQQAIEIADTPVIKPDCVCIDENHTITDDIPDAEWLLYEMDANDCDEITVEKRAYTRAQVEKSLRLK